MFDDFESEPLGTASLAQVHRAKLKDGTDVAVKVQHHFVRKNIGIDLQWMEFIIKAMSKVFPDFEMQWLIDETKKNIAKELDFLQEGKNAERVSSMFSHYKWLKVPKIFWDYSTERVLVMEYVEGGLVNDTKYIEVSIIFLSKFKLMLNWGPSPSKAHRASWAPYTKYFDNYFLESSCSLLPKDDAVLSKTK